MAENQTKTVSFQDLPELRRKTEAVAALLRERLTQHLDTLRPIFAPERVFGKYAGGKTSDAAAERAYVELQQGYKPFVAKPFDLPQTFDAHWLTLVGNRLVLYPWEYAHEAKSDKERKNISMTTPLKWVVAFTSDYAPTQMRQALSGKDATSSDKVRQFVVNALVLQAIINKNPGLTALLNDLRYEVKVENSPELKNLPLVTVQSSIPCFCPADDLILAAAAFSGIPAFIELINVDGVRDAKDPATARIEELLK
jgi:hypothetical protein